MRAALAGALTGILAVLVWAVLVGLTGLRFELEWLPMIATAYLVGTMVRVAGRRGGRHQALLGGALAFFATLGGSVLASLLAVSWQLDAGAGWTLLQEAPPGEWTRLYLGSLGLLDALLLLAAAGLGAHRAGSQRPEDDELPSWLGTAGMLAAGAVVLLVWFSLSRVEVRALTVSPDGALAATWETVVDGGSRVRTHDLATGETRVVLGGADPRPLGGDDRVAAPAFHPREASLVVARHDREAREDRAVPRRFSWLLQVEPTHGGVTQLGRVDGRALGLALASRGTRLMVRTHEHAVQVLDVPSLRLRHRLEHPAAVECMAPAADGLRLATGGRDGRLRLWDLLSGRLRVKRQAHPHRVRALAVHPGGAPLASVGHLDRRVLLWESDLSGPRRTLTSTLDWVTCVAFDPRAPRLAVGGGSFAEGGRVDLWNHESGRVERRFRVDSATARAVAFGRGGEELLIGTGLASTVLGMPGPAQVLRFRVETGEGLPPLGGD